MKLGFEPLGSTSEAMDRHLEREVAKWAKVIEASSVRLK
jgi:hypothetical protein